MKIQNKVIAVTGAGSGIGKSVVLQLLAGGSLVAAIDINQDSLDALATEVSDESNLATFLVDISDRAKVDLFAEQVKERFGHVDGVINCAGIIQPFVKVNDLSYEAIDKVMRVNFYGTLHMVKALLPHLLERPEAHIVNISSMGGFLPVPGQTAYGASKAAVKLLTEGLYAELLDTNVRVSVVFAGATRTNIVENSGVEAPVSGDNQDQYPALSAEDAASLIIKGMEKNKPIILTGKDAKFMYKLYRFNPIYATKLIAKQMQSLLKG